MPPFGRLAAKPAPERKVYQNLEIKGRKTVFGVKSRILPASGNGIQWSTRRTSRRRRSGHRLALLNNNSQTGTMDKLVLDGELTSAGAYTRTFHANRTRHRSGHSLYDENQRRLSLPRAPKESRENHPANRQRRIRGLEN